MMKKTTSYGLLFFSLLFSLISAAQSTATYDISFQSTWNSTDHGTLPSNAHWSNLVGANHNSSITFLAMGEHASPGIENVAELGSNTVFNSEVQTAIGNGNAEQWLNEPFAPYAAISSASLSDITVSEDFPLLTLAAMIAPSPDWMIAVNSLNLWDPSQNKWKESFIVDLFPYDAGTEDGLGYSGNNAPTNPQDVITNISGVEGYPFNTEKIGTLTITFKSTTLSVDGYIILQPLKMYPNPNTTGTLTLENAEKVKRIVIYDVLGKAVKSIVFNPMNNSQDLDVSTLKNGIYIVRLTNADKSVISRKLVIN